MTDDITKRRPGLVRSLVTRRPERVLLPPSDECCSHLLEVFVLDTVGTRPVHAVWLHHLKVGGYRWKCSCDAQRSHHVLDAALLAEARAHFDQVWEHAAVSIWHPVAVWNDRATWAALTKADLEKLTIELAHGGTGGDVDVAVEAVNLCGTCGNTFQITADDPHWSTGRGPICSRQRL